MISRAMLDRLAPFAEQVATAAIISFNTVSHSRRSGRRARQRRAGRRLLRRRRCVQRSAAGAKFFAARTNLSWGTMLAEARHST
ncbi:MAG: hypothetical protein WKF58_16020 [Ilumatobacteraceae bacterium]